MDKDNQDFETICIELKRHLSRLSFVGMGQSDELDQSLAKLRKLIKNTAEESDIKDAIDEISKVLRGLDDEPTTSLSTKANEDIDLIELLTQQKLPKRLNNSLVKMNKKSKNKDANNIMVSIAEVIKNYIEEIESNIDTTEKQKGSKPGFLGSLFSKKSSGENLELLTQEQESKRSKEGSLSIQLTENNDTLANVKNNINHLLPTDIKDSLQQLVEQLASMDGYQEVAGLLETEIAKIQNISQLSSILELITSAFIEISDQEHMQFEAFLKSLNKRIIRVNSFISKTLEFSQSNEKDTKQLNLDLTQDIFSIKESLSNSKDLAEAEEKTVTKMDKILSKINQFCTKQQSQSSELISQVEKLKEQMNATEDEASRLKDDLAEQRMRAQTDQLTNLPNRYAYNERLTQEYNRWRRYRNSLTLVVGDIDLFKSVNDSHGHSFGDLVLKKIATCLHAGIRESDFVARFGGEEFVILLPETTLTDATRAMNKMRQSVSQIALENNGEKVEVTMSFGISEFTNDDTTKAVFERADSALYRAKEKGRNRVCCQRATEDPKEN
ncbi:MAG: diguanylate cyclase [Polaribacter sp.]|jgi:diguanylate cyclase